MTVQAISESLYREYREPHYSPPPLLARMVSAGLLGKKSGRGAYLCNRAPCWQAGLKRGVLPRALKLIDTTWVLRLDPDERVPASLAAKILEATASAPELCARSSSDEKSLDPIGWRAEPSTLLPCFVISSANCFSRSCPNA